MAKQLEKAKVKVLQGARAGESVEVLFNPTEYTHQISNKYQESSVPGLNNPVLQFVNGETQSVTLDLFFDTWSATRPVKDASEATKKFATMLAIDRELHAPSPVEFSWGGFSFQAVLQSLSQKFTMFDADGTPVRATLNVTFKQYRPLREQLEQPRRNSADKTKARVLTADDSLWALAAREYGHPRYWRLIARHNRIENPRQLPAGTVVVLPPLENDDGSALA